MAQLSPRQLSPMQRKVYERLREHHQRSGELPEPSTLARQLGVHYVSLRQHLEALDRKGFLVFESRGRGKSPRLELPAEATGIPVLGSIPAGPLSEAVSHAESYLPLAGLRDRHFALRVHGDSMADLIQNGDVVLLEKQQPARSGEICALRVDESDVTLKYLDFLGKDTYALRPHNPDYPTAKISARELAIEGVYRGLLRGEVLQSLLQDSSYG